MIPALSDRDVTMLAVAICLLARQAHRIAQREAQLVALAGERFKRHGRNAVLRPRVLARVHHVAERLRAGELETGDAR